MPVVLALLVLAPRGVEGQAANDLVKLEFFPNGETGVGSPIVLSFSGRRYGPETKTSPPAAEQQLVDSIAKANSTGNVSEIAKLWEPAELPALQKLAADPKAWDSNAGFYQAVKRTDLRLRIDYGSYNIFIVTHIMSDGAEITRAYPFKRIKNVLLLSNSLSSDPMFAYFSTRYARELTKRPAKQ